MPAVCTLRKSEVSGHGGCVASVSHAVLGEVKLVQTLLFLLRRQSAARRAAELPWKAKSGKHCLSRATNCFGGGTSGRPLPPATPESLPRSALHFHRNAGREAARRKDAAARRPLGEAVVKAPPSFQDLCPGQGLCLRLCVSRIERCALNCIH